MPTPNVIGYVTEFIEERPITPRRDAEGKILELIPGEVQVSLKLRLKNTSGQTREILVQGPSDLSAFFSPETKTVGQLVEQLANDLAGKKDYHDKVVDAVEASDALCDQAFEEVVNASNAELRERLKGIQDTHEVRLREKLDNLRELLR